MFTSSRFRPRMLFDHATALDGDGKQEAHARLRAAWSGPVQVGMRVAHVRAALEKKPNASSEMMTVLQVAEYLVCNPEDLRC